MTNPFQKKSNRRRMRRGTKNLLVLFGAVAFWFLGVDFVFEVERCPDCNFGRDHAQHRILGIHVTNWSRDAHSGRDLLLRDLGSPCEHENITRWRKHRWWGLVFCKCPCINGVYRGVVGDDWYDEMIRPYVYQYAEDHPGAGPMLWALIIAEDFDGIREIWDDVICYDEDN